MNREDAEEALVIVRQVIQNTREDLVSHNWGQIWMVHAFTNLAACLGGWYVEAHDWGLVWYLVPLAVTAVVNILVVLCLLTRDQGIRSYVEWQIHGIWVTFIIFTLAGAMALHLSDAPPRLFGPLFSMTSGIGFAMMTVVFKRQFPYAVYFLIMTAIGPLLPGLQWGLIGLGWWGAMFITGWSMNQENQRRRHDESATAIL